MQVKELAHTTTSNRLLAGVPSFLHFNTTSKVVHYHVVALFSSVQTYCSQICFVYFAGMFSLVPKPWKQCVVQVSNKIFLGLHQLFIQLCRASATPGGCFKRPIQHTVPRVGGHYQWIGDIRLGTHCMNGVCTGIGEECPEQLLKKDYSAMTSLIYGSCQHCLPS